MSEASMNRTFPYLAHAPRGGGKSVRLHDRMKVGI